jgi:hypothetical protein
MSEQQPLTLPKLPGPGISARRIRFVPQLSAHAKFRREFREPRTCYALEETVDLAELPCDRPWPEPTDTLLVLHMPSNASAEWQRFGEAWMMPPTHPEAVQPTVIQGRGRRVQWRPGRALIVGDSPAQDTRKPPQTDIRRGPAPVSRGPAAQDAQKSSDDSMPEDVLAALIDFSFYEAELRNLELAVRIGENQMPDDVSKIYKIRFRDRQMWPRFTEMIEYFARLILVHSLLEPRLRRASRTLPPLSRRWVKRLLDEADIEERLDELDTRLEIGEALYEGANDRVADFKGYHFGHVLEVLIILFLVAEVVLMILELQALERD